MISEWAGGMGGLEQVYVGQVASAEVFVKISAERAHWVLSVKTPRVTRWIVPGAWQAYLDNHEVVGTTIGDQVEFIKTRLPEVVASGAKDLGLEAKLVRLGSDYMRRLMGDY